MIFVLPVGVFFAMVRQFLDLNATRGGVLRTYSLSSLSICL